VQHAPGPYPAHARWWWCVCRDHFPATIGAIRLEILADEAMTAALMNTRAANETTPSCRVTKPKRVFLMGGQWQKGNEPNLTNRVKVAMEQVLAEEHGE